MKSNSDGIDVETYAISVAKSKKYTDLQMNTISSEIYAKVDKSDFDGLKFMHLTKAEYETLKVKDSGTVYFVS